MFFMFTNCQMLKALYDRLMPRFGRFPGGFLVKYFLGVVALVEGKTSPMTHLTRFWNQYLMIYSYFPENCENAMKFLLFVFFQNTGSEWVKNP
jgi:hypothetical protein